MRHCSSCDDEHYILHVCCGGHECGCMGKPVLMTNCTVCNPDGDKPPGDYVKGYAKHLEYIKVEV